MTGMKITPIAQTKGRDFKPEVSWAKNAASKDGATKVSEGKIAKDTQPRKEATKAADRKHVAPEAKKRAESPIARAENRKETTNGNQRPGAGKTSEEKSPNAKTSGRNIPNSPGANAPKPAEANVPKSSDPVISGSGEASERKYSSTIETKLGIYEYQRKKREEETRKKRMEQDAKDKQMRANTESASTQKEKAKDAWPDLPLSSQKEKTEAFGTAAPPVKVLKVIPPQGKPQSSPKADSEHKVPTPVKKTQQTPTQPKRGGKDQEETQTPAPTPTKTKPEGKAQGQQPRPPAVEKSPVQSREKAKETPAEKESPTTATKKDHICAEEKPQPPPEQKRQAPIQEKPQLQAQKKPQAPAQKSQPPTQEKPQPLGQEDPVEEKLQPAAQQKPQPSTQGKPLPSARKEPPAPSQKTQSPLQKEPPASTQHEQNDHAQGKPQTRFQRTRTPQLPKPQLPKPRPPTSHEPESSTEKEDPPLPPGKLVLRKPNTSVKTPAAETRKAPGSELPAPKSKHDQLKTNSSGGGAQENANPAPGSRGTYVAPQRREFSDAKTNGDQHKAKEVEDGNARRNF